ncbi:hypothetical protein Bbelb_220510 [Branchiostoma belcheri]|nr:hypothetical protein Bbelb_220510 [Branchiostoma belcheri]
MATTDTISIPEKGNLGDAKIHSKAANRGKHAYEQTIIGKETAVGPHGTATGICTNLEPGHQPSVPNIYTPAPTRGENTQHVKEEVSSVPEKSIGGDNKNRSKAAHPRKHAYEQTIIGKEAAAGTYGTAAGICTNPEPEHQPSVPNIYTPAPTSGKSVQHVKEKVPSVPEKSIGEGNKNRSKAAHRGKQAYEQTIIGKEVAAGPYGTAASIYTNPQPVAAEPRYLRVGDHVVVCSGQESGEDCGYLEAEEVSKGYEEDHHYSDYEKPEDVHTYKGFEENHSSHDYDKPEDVYGYKDPEEKSFACRDKASVAISVILATHITHGGRVALQQNVTSMVLNPLRGLSSSPWQPAFYGENNSAFDDFKVVNSTPTYLPSTNSIVTAEALTTTVTSLSTTDVNEFKVVNSTPTYLPSTNSIVTAEALSTTVTSLSTTDVNEFKVVNSTPTYLPSTNSIVTAEALSTAVTSLSTTALRCQTGWSEYNNRCYKLMTDKTCWSKAKKRCAKHGAILATIKDADENNFIAGLIVNALSTYEKECGKVKHTALPADQPPAVVPCTTTGKAWRLGRKRYRGQWDDTICTLHYPYLCEKPILIVVGAVRARGRKSSGPPASHRFPDRTIMVVSSNKDSPTVLTCLYLIKRAWNRPNSSNSCGKHRECYYRRPDNQDICLQYLCYQTTA